MASNKQINFQVNLDDKNANQAIERLDNNVGDLNKKLNKTEDEIEKAYLAAYKYCSKRAEPLYRLAYYFRMKNNLLENIFFFTTIYSNKIFLIIFFLQ